MYHGIGALTFGALNHAVKCLFSGFGHHLGVFLDLFHIDPLSPGSPFYHPMSQGIALEGMRLVIEKLVDEDSFLEIKALFDPYGIMNPGVIISENDNLLGENLKYGPDFTIVKTGTSFDSASLQEQISNCSGCAKCRSYCPIASSHLEEWAKGRGKVNLETSTMGSEASQAENCTRPGSAVNPAVVSA